MSSDTIEGRQEKAILDTGCVRSVTWEAGSVKKTGRMEGQMDKRSDPRNFYMYLCIRGGHFCKKLDFELAEKLPPFSCLH